MEFNKYKGIVELEIYGEKRYFKFGTMQMDLLCELEGKTVQELVPLLDDKTNVKIQISFYFCAALAYVRLYNDEHEDKLKEPTRNQVANWMDSVGDDKRDKMNKTAFAQAFPNEEAPKEEKETQGQS